ncbi:MAG: helix-turn-helix transcriptional regulator [Mycobacteriales bacterium]
MREREVAELLGCSIRTLQGWRWRGGGPPFIRVGRSVRYDPSGLRAWVGAQTRRNTSDLR